MTKFNFNVIKQELIKTKLFNRYVDYCFALFEKENEVVEFLNNPNSHQSSLQLTIEKENIPANQLSGYGGVS